MNTSHSLKVSVSKTFLSRFCETLVCDHFTIEGLLLTECFDKIECFVRIECFDQRRNVLKLFFSYVFFSVVVGKEIKSKSIQLDNIFDATLICFHYFCNLMHFSNKVF